MATIEGTLNSDTIAGTTANDTIWGDTDVGAPASDVVTVGAGDSISTDAGDDLVYGQGGNDIIEGGAGNDTLYGGVGHDTLIGGTGDDSLSGYDGDWISYADATGGVTVWLDDAGDGWATGAAGNDSLSSTRNILGGAGNDSITGSDSIRSLDVTNIFDGGAGDDTIYGGAGFDRLIGDAGNDWLHSGGGRDSLSGNDTIDGGTGNDTIIGGVGNDSLIAGTGDDIVWGDETVSGAYDLDTIYMDSNVGAPYDDTLSGGALDPFGGNDTLFWQDGMGSDTAWGGGGTDSLSLLGDTAGYSFVANTTRDSLNDWYVFKSGGTDTLTLFDFEVVCFASGTMIATARGEVAVEDLRLGDLVVTAGCNAGLQPIQWIGRTTCRVARHPDRAKVAPVLVKAGALGSGVPLRDLRVSPDHALFLDGHLVPAKYLVNGTSIIQELWCPEVTYWHVEMPSHTLLVSDGALTESYLDDGNRRHFDNGAITALFPDFESERANGLYDRDACYPVLRGGDRLEAIRARIAAGPGTPGRSHVA